MFDKTFFYLFYIHINFAYFQCAKTENGHITPAFLFYFLLIFNTNFFLFIFYLLHWDP